jgi:serine/threonine protein kinase
MTQEGTIVGTFQYMSPEQVEGKGVDGRSDIFSLGAVLYEMVTGKKAFEGKSQLSVASAILEKEPEAISAMKPLTPPALDHAIRRCLAKDPDDRWQNSRDLASELKWIAEGSSQSASPVSRAPRGKLREILLGSLAATFALAAIVLGMLLWREHSVKDDRVVRFDISPPERGSIRLPSYPNLAISPDGTQIVYKVFEAGGARLYVRNIGSLAGQPIPGTEDAVSPFFSPDGRWLAFFASKELKRVSPYWQWRRIGACRYVWPSG